MRSSRLPYRCAWPGLGLDILLPLPAEVADNHLKTGVCHRIGMMFGPQHVARIKRWADAVNMTNCRVHGWVSKASCGPDGDVELAIWKMACALNRRVPVGSSQPD